MQYIHVDYTNISPNRNSPRNNNIDTITIHCVVGQCTVEALGDVFAPVARQASSNFGVGADGRIGMYCPPEDRSWCSSSADNDNRAITIETASDTTHPYAVNAVAYTALITLCAQICREYGKTKMVWCGSLEATNSRSFAPNEMRMTLHKWFDTGTMCPGQYLESHMEDIAEQVNKLLKSGGAATPTAPTPSGTSVPKPILKTFKARTSETSPTSIYNNPCYNTNGGGGAVTANAWNTCIFGSPTVAGANALDNCVGYAQGRALEIYMQLDPSCKPAQTGKHPWMYCNGAPSAWISQAESSGLKTGKTPKEGAVLVWSGHVAVVEKVNKENGQIVSIETTEGGYDGGYNGKRCDYVTHTNPDGRWGASLADWSSSYSFLGFVYQPVDGYAGDGSAVPSMGTTTTNTRKDISTRTLTKKEVDELIKKYHGYEAEVTYKEITTTRTIEGIQSSNTDLSRVRGPQLLSFPSLVEAPFCILNVGGYSFGSYMEAGNIAKVKYVKYPNFITSARVEKINGTVNQYTIVLTYQIEAGNDPNMIDKILSKVGYGTVYISYGDWACPNFIYKEEEAIITNVSSKVDFSSSRITYTVSCTSNSIALAGTSFNFASRKAKPSDVIFEMLYNKQYGLTELFTGMKNSTKVRTNGLIASNDQVVDIPSKEAMDPLTYLNYLVSCMSSNTNSTNSVLKDSTYYLTIDDDASGKLGGPYFKITEVKANNKAITSSDTYVVDVGFPSDSLVTNFTINDDNSWALLYNYASSVDKQTYTYSLDDKGDIVTRYSPNITTSSKSFITTEAQKTWWTNMTRFPITAELTIKGLIRPTMLMTYVRINSFFYGQKHISSGLYVITKQVDTIDGTGYRTTLSLTRIGGADDYITSITQKITTKKPEVKLKIGDGVAKEFNKLHVKLANEYGGEGSEIHISSSGEIHG